MKKIISVLLFVLFWISPIKASEPQPYVLLISLDGFRWDYAERGITPNLDKIKQEGVSALSFKPSFPSVTFPNHLSIITGMYPQNHGLILNFFENLYGERYRLSDTNAVKNPAWYWGEAFWETARRNKIITASYYWPGSEVWDENRRPNYYKAYNHNEPHENKINGIIEWLKLPYNERPHFITLYFHDTDSEGHKHGTNSPQIDSTIAVLDSLIGVIRQRIELIGMKDSVNIIILSDHGMTNIREDGIINIKEIIGEIDCDVNSSSAITMIKPKNEKDIELVFNKLKKAEQNYKVYYKKDVPAYWNFSRNPYIYPIVVIADVGYKLIYGKSTYNAVAEHGYDSHHIDMHGIFFAVGSKFKKNYRVGTLENVDIYPLLCEIFKIDGRSNIDGNINRIKYLLK
ncbi:MAG TPA: ectonucleotide pyrophosphatase/phosphodiesterase [Candidatus Kapabacteria bacterium]|jgi:ectonucleotide pyrophosphatase/phosphodiesterase family protein 5|nr:ectonucleotide pyrophosphatase/phosphodiesterase [Candidatus Kapabacteria bacterium]